MKHLDLHILQSVPVSCLVRDELGNPKTADFGGVTRARLSSQSMKRAIRELAKELASERKLGELFSGFRTRYIFDPFVKAFTDAKALKAASLKPLSAEKAAAWAHAVGTYWGKLDTDDERRVKTTVFLSPQEVSGIVQKLLRECKADVPDEKAVEKASKHWRDANLRYDAADIALFGRMVASDDSLGVDGASLFAHALSTHAVENDFDFFSAVDEAKPAGAAFGAAMTDNLVFNSACYYRFVSLNIPHLADREHNLAAVPPEALRDVVDIFVRATLLALPTARKATMNADALPEVVLAVVKEKGHPLQLVNAFEEAVTASRKGGFVAKSAQLMLKKHKRLVEGYCLGPDIKAQVILNLSDGFAPEAEELAFDGAPPVKPVADINELCKEILKHAL